ncbi:carbonic anhydrase [Micropruina sonneratiae]|uniref:carbonic anhydrase n=1 Tax=Micropruina sonneratiae TaxID=2986940 RepID=UPI002227611C|nr:carbonic anhydrase [Micropruina sp. KQZ13P-5]MCW3159125.1 hypothetical protein [Micropruina sp. KQZ13P-5]
MAVPASVPEWLRPVGLPVHRMPSAQALQRLKAGNERYCKQRAGEGAPPGDAAPAQFPFALVVGCLEPGAAAEEFFAERPGAILCLRTAGPSLGADAVAGIEYAVLVQNVAVVLVLAHRGCAAVETARVARQAGVALPGSLDGWVRSAAAGTPPPTSADPGRGGLVPRPVAALVPVAAAGGQAAPPTAGEPVEAHVRALRADLRRADSLLTLTRSGKVKIAGGVLDRDSGAIDFLPDEPDPFDLADEPAAVVRPDPTRYGS